jgi:hypothetical protein
MPDLSVSFPSLRILRWNVDIVYKNYTTFLRSLLEGTARQLEAISLDYYSYNELPEDLLDRINHKTLCDYRDSQEPSPCGIRNLHYLIQEGGPHYLKTFVDHLKELPISELPRLLYLPESFRDEISEDTEYEAIRRELLKVCKDRDIDFAFGEKDWDEDREDWVPNTPLWRDFRRRIKVENEKREQRGEGNYRSQTSPSPLD